MTGIRKRSRWTLLLLGMLLLICGWIGYVWMQILQVNQQAGPQQADVAIVLGAAVWGDRPSPGLRERLDTALQLYREGYVPRIIVSGGLGEGKLLSEAAVMREYLIAQGIPAEAILIEDQATSTYENLLFSKALMEQHGLKTALIVSHTYHLARAIDMAAELGIAAHPVGAASHVLNLPYHTTRETLAYTLWKLSAVWPFDEPVKP